MIQLYRLRGCRILGTRLQVIGIAVASVIAITTFRPGLLSSIAQQLRINSLLGQFRKQEEQEFKMKVEDVTAAQTPSPTNEALSAGGL